MKIIENNKENMILSFSRDEVLILKNSLNEVYNGINIEDWEFLTRMGCDRKEASELLEQLYKLI